MYQDDAFGSACVSRWSTICGKAHARVQSVRRACAVEQHAAGMAHLRLVVPQVVLFFGAILLAFHADREGHCSTQGLSVLYEK